MGTSAEATAALERAWWLRTLRILLHPREVFAAIRDEPLDDAGPLRSEPMLAIAWLAGIAAVLAALSLVVWPVRLALYGDDVFRSGGSDTGAPNAVFGAIEACFGTWTLA